MIPIAELNISAQTRNFIRQGDMFTVGELQVFVPPSMMYVKGQNKNMFQVGIPNMVKVENVEDKVRLVLVTDQVSYNRADLTKEEALDLLNQLQGLLNQPQTLLNH